MARIVNAYLDLAELRAEVQIPMTMEDWAEQFEGILKLSKKEILTDVSGECSGIFCLLTCGRSENRIISCYLALIIPYFVDEIGEYGRNNTRRTGEVCDMDSCNGLCRIICLYNRI